MKRWSGLSIMFPIRRKRRVYIFTFSSSARSTSAFSVEIRLTAFWGVWGRGKDATADGTGRLSSKAFEESKHR